ncbi:membrane-spanning 4-domains subfamily A member 4D isoform X1 [Amia ocellicauda]|uniref:membrane-spanning 4-domains subfamily A member 4D isoform X1 n=1 Tax=Amia ocellicauda TaxID=2972642 RepID=UPI003463AFEA
MEELSPAASASEETARPATEEGPLVTVSFQKNSSFTQKFLEGEPKALGITQIMLSVHVISIALMNWFNEMEQLDMMIVRLICSLITIIAGGVAISASNLHMPRIKACMAMEIIGCVCSVFLIFANLAIHTNSPIMYSCWMRWNKTMVEERVCQQLTEITDHISAEQLLVQVVITVLCITLAVYCGKAVRCCSPASRMPVITVNAPGPAQSQQ